MRKRKNHWEVEQPKDNDTPLTREQGWAVLAGLRTTLSLTAYRLSAGPIGQSDDSVLPEDEAVELKSIVKRLDKLAKVMELDVLDKLAQIKEDEARQREKEEDRFHWLGDDAQVLPREVKVLLTDYDGDISRYERSGGSAVVLALGILQNEVLEPGEIYDLIHKHFNPDSKYSDWHTCPQCDDWNGGKVGDDLCRRCSGWGFLYGEKPDDDEYDWSEKGRHALNRGETWTAEQEAEEQERLEAEY